MINWELLSPRNIAVIAIMSVVAFAVYNYFQKKVTGGTNANAS